MPGLSRIIKGILEILDKRINLGISKIPRGRIIFYPKKPYSSLPPSNGSSPPLRKRRLPLRAGTDLPTGALGRRKPVCGVVLASSLSMELCPQVNSPAGSLAMSDRPCRVLGRERLPLQAACPQVATPPLTSSLPTGIAFAVRMCRIVLCDSISSHIV
ncbi:hypothetical protein BHE74_00034720 [Ensete ventricosum]|nr:hypothetical protein BHE74_00034720 [Ensete ventricosum]